jgi:hypothetical protein
MLMKQLSGSRKEERRGCIMASMLIFEVPLILRLVWELKPHPV